MTAPDECRGMEELRELGLPESPWIGCLCAHCLEVLFDYERMVVTH